MLFKYFRKVWNFVVVLAWITLFAIITHFSLAMYCGSEDFMLVAKNDIPVFLTEENAWYSSDCKNMAILDCGKIVQAAQCISGKDRMTYRIQLPSGSYGYISSGDYVVMRVGRNNFCRCVERVIVK
jgi:hypothetical protein